MHNPEWMDLTEVSDVSFYNTWGDKTKHKDPTQITSFPGQFQVPKDIGNLCFWTISKRLKIEMHFSSSLIDAST